MGALHLPIAAAVPHIRCCGSKPDCAVHGCWLQFAVGSKIIAEEGVGALYRGLSAGLLRQATYTTARLGIYQYISDVLAKRHDGKVRACRCAYRVSRGRHKHHHAVPARPLLHRAPAIHTRHVCPNTCPRSQTLMRAREPNSWSEFLDEFLLHREEHLAVGNCRPDLWSRSVS